MMKRIQIYMMDNIIPQGEIKAKQEHVLTTSPESLINF